MIIAKYITVICMIALGSLYPQSRFSFGGLAGNSGTGMMLLNSLESNGVLYLPKKDWLGTVTAGRETANNVANVLYEIALGRNFGRNDIYFRYTPGYRREFSFVRDENYLVNDSTDASLNSNITYNENFGAGYSFQMNEYFKAGLSIRNFSRAVEDNTVGVVFTEDTLYLISEKMTESSTRWQIDAGFSFSLFRGLTIDISTHNFYVISDENAYSDNAVYTFNDEKNYSIAAGWQFSNESGIYASIESNGSVLGGVHYPFMTGQTSVSGGISYFKNSTGRTFSGMIPTLQVKYKDFGLRASAVIYSDRQNGFTVSEFEKNPIASLINDGYSGDKYILSFIYHFNVASAKPVTFSDIEITGEIFPVFPDEFVDKPIARARVINLTGSRVEVKPESFIEELNDSKISSPVVSIGAYDTIWVPFYTIPSEKYAAKKTRLTNITLSIYTENSSDPADEVSRPVMVNGINSWDGKTKNLRYFVKKELLTSAERAKAVVTGITGQDDSTGSILRTFRNIKNIYNSVIPNLTYVADPFATADFVQYPSETLQSKGGDCDDMSVLFASLYEGVGIETAFVDYSSDDGISHVNLLVNSGLEPEQAYLITSNEKKYHIRKDIYGKQKVWIPLEVTDLTGFDGAWSNGAERFYREAIQGYGLVKGSISIIEIH